MSTKMWETNGKYLSIEKILNDQMKIHSKLFLNHRIYSYLKKEDIKVFDVNTNTKTLKWGKIKGQDNTLVGNSPTLT